MQVVAFTSPEHPGWRWRIVNYDGGMVEESYESFTTIATAVTDGGRRLTELSADDLTNRHMSLRASPRMRNH